MTRAFPFIRASRDSVRGDLWALQVTDGSLPLPDVLPDWDYNTSLRLHRQVVVDGRRVREEASLPATARLGLSVRWTASGSLLRGSAVTLVVPTEDGAALDLEFVLPGGELGGTLTLETVLSTAAPVEDGPVYAASRPGSVLWSDTYDVRLQGDAPLFPLALTDFAEVAFPEGAAWYLQVGDDLDAAAMGSMLLLVNSRSELLVRALSEAAAPAPDAAAVLSVLSTEIAGTLVEHALAVDGFSPSRDYEPRSLGALFTALLTQLGFEDWESLRREHDAEPALFAARMQAATKLWQGLR